MPRSGATDLPPPVSLVEQAPDIVPILRRARRAPGDAANLLLVASDPQVIAAARDASRRLHGPRPIQILTGAEALHRLVGPGHPPHQLVLEGGSAGAMLLSAARDRFSTTDVIIVARPGDLAPEGLRSVPAVGARLAEALAAPRPPEALPCLDAAALAEGLARGEITVRFQPVVRLADRRLVMVEALARWERPEAAHGAGAFIAMAEEAGLATELTLAVARRALAALGRRDMLLSFNASLGALLRPDLPGRLAAMVAEAGVRPHNVLLELTESTAVRDTALLRRALQRLDSVGFGVLLDDLGLDDPRSVQLDLPFRGVKLDRSLTTALPRMRRARALVERLVRQAHRRGRVVIAEGVTDPCLWRLTAAAGCDLAQGFGVGRPILPEALPGWMAAWNKAALRSR
jgi:EAL domain-containing protein (putative c-di-GMP-specific phosphodiesterase class I)